MSWGDLFLASRQVIFGDKEPGTDELANSLWGISMPTRFTSANLTKGKETRTVPMRCSRKWWWPSRERQQASPCFPRLHDNQGDGTCRSTCIRQPTLQNP